MDRMIDSSNYWIILATIHIAIDRNDEHIERFKTSFSQFLIRSLGTDRKFLFQLVNFYQDIQFEKGKNDNVFFTLTEYILIRILEFYTKCDIRVVVEGCLEYLSDLNHPFDFEDIKLKILHNKTFLNKTLNHEIDGISTEMSTHSVIIQEYKNILNGKTHNTRDMYKVNPNEKFYNISNEKNLDKLRTLQERLTDLLSSPSIDYIDLFYIVYSIQFAKKNKFEKNAIPSETPRRKPSGRPTPSETPGQKPSGRPTPSETPGRKPSGISETAESKPIPVREFTGKFVYEES